MALSNFSERLRAAQVAHNSLLCVGLDPAIDRFPEPFQGNAGEIRAFNRAIIDATADLACCYKPNLGFYLLHGQAGLDALIQLRSDVPDEIPLLLDAKMGDFDVTSEGYARAYFDAWDFDAVTAHPYMGRDGLEPLFGRPGKCVFLLARTSNPGSGFLQSKWIEAEGRDKTVAEYVAASAAEWNTESQAEIGLVVGATYPDDLKSIRAFAPDLDILIPGIGPQGGDLEATVRAGVTEDGHGVLINSSRGISYASAGRDFQEKAREAALQLRDAINDARELAISS